MIVVLFVGINNVRGQGAGLTKEETVAYINKKLNEAVGHYQTIDNDDGSKQKMYYWESSVKLTGDNLVVTRTRSKYKPEEINNYKTVSYVSPQNIYRIEREKSYPCDYAKFTYETSFNPLHISKIELYKGSAVGEPAGAISITLKSKTAKMKIIGQSAKYKLGYDEYSDKYGNGGSCIGLKTEEVTQSGSLTAMNFLLADESNFGKIKRALEYLASLLKAEDDPFGE